MQARLLITILFQIFIVSVYAQQYWANPGASPNAFFSLDVNCYCPDCGEDELVGPTQSDMQRGLSMTPNGNIYGLSNQNDIFQINPANGFATLVLDLPWILGDFTLQGLACTTNNICYSVDASQVVDTLYEINLVTGTATPLGAVTQRISLGDLALYAGDLYYESSPGLNLGFSKITLSDPIVTELLFDLPDNLAFHPMTATTQCHTFLSQTTTPSQCVLINKLDGDIVFISEPMQDFFGITSLLEFEIPDCIVSLDLDCDDSSGAVDADFNSTDYNCLSTEGARICDEDVLFLYDTLIDFVRMELTGFIPDGVNEYLELEQTYPGLTITGSGTSTILIQNEGLAPSTYFKQAMRATRYHNDLFEPTIGIRTVAVNGTTFYGTEMNEGIARLEVTAWPSYDLDLGLDVEVCEGESLMLNTELEDVEHQWSTNETTSSIIVTESGNYSVTVTGDEFCPNIDSIEVIFLQSVEVSLGNDQVVCEGEEVIVTIETESDIPLTINIIRIPGDTITINGVTDDTEILVVIQEPTSFIIHNVTSAEPICLEIEDGEQIFDVFPAYMDTISAGICEGDSFLIAPNEYVYQPGIYTVFDNTAFGCDSIVTYNVQESNSINFQIEQNTCIAADTGVFYQWIENPSGCDTLLEIHVILGTLDTTFVSGMTCVSGGEGIITETLTSIDGCDSVVVQDIMLSPPQDTSWANQTSCDVSEHGIFYSIYPNQAGCDSLVILTVSMGETDTTNVNTTSCDPAEWGVFETLWQNQFQCDSLIIMTVTESPADTTYLFLTSCDSSSLGVFETWLVSSKECDSLIIETVTYATKDTTELSAGTCDPDEAGVFTTSLINQFGCDSIVIETISLHPSHHHTFQFSSCMPADTGTFVQQLLNQYGCDSVVITIVALWPSHFLWLEEESCILSDTGTFVTFLQNQYGCDSIVSRHIRFSEIDTTLIAINTCDPDEAGLHETWLTTAEGCDSLVITTTIYHPLSIDINIVSDFNGYAVSCYESEDGEVHVVADGFDPLSFIWSTQATDPVLTALPAGSYEVTVTDGNGCVSVSDVNLSAPPPMMVEFAVSMPDCFEQEVGFITANPTGGITPYAYSLDGINFQSSNTFSPLEEGTYEITVRDANQCTSEDIIWVNQVIPVDVSLGDNIELFIGDTAVIEAIVNIPVDSISNVDWNGLVNTDCPTCLTQQVFPIVTTSYSIEVVSVDGCTDRDTMIVHIVRDSTIYIPNVFSPNGDGQNDVLLFYTGVEIEMISSFAIYDRWGGNMFLQENRTPGDPLLYWDGTSGGSPCLPGVYVYRLVAVINHQDKIIRTGDVTLLK